MGLTSAFFIPNPGNVPLAVAITCPIGQLQPSPKPNQTLTDLLFCFLLAYFRRILSWDCLVALATATLPLWRHRGTLQAGAQWLAGGPTGKWGVDAVPLKAYRECSSSSHSSGSIATNMATALPQSPMTSTGLSGSWVISGPPSRSKLCARHQKRLPN